MAFEESLDRLKERHEALTQSVEILFDSMDRYHRRLEQIARTELQNQEAQATNEALMVQVMQSVARLTRISGLEAQ
jgi:hypothetical protein